jgi:hypothetical protein
MKMLLITTLMMALASVAYPQAESNPAKTDCKEERVDKKVQKGKAKSPRGETPGSAAEGACPQPSAPAADAPPAATAPTPTAALSAATVAPQSDKSQLNVTIYHDSEESLGAVARRIRTRKAMEEANKSQ